MIKKDILDYASDIALTADGFDEAIIGVTTQGLVTYDYDKCVEVLMEEGMGETEAVEHLQFNVAGAWMGEGTPIFIIT